MDAVAALRNLVDAFHKDDLPSIQPLIPNLLNQLFALMKEVRSRAAPAIPWLARRCPGRAGVVVLVPFQCMGVSPLE